MHARSRAGAQIAAVAGTARACRLLAAGLTGALILAGCSAQPFRMTRASVSPRNNQDSTRLAWARRTYYGAGVGVTLTLPAAWAPRLPPMGFHYGATLAYLASYPPRPICRPARHGLTCDPRRAGPYPPGGITLTVTVAGFGPGPIPQQQIFATGTAMVIGGRRAVRRPSDPAGCVGTGATNAVSYAIEDGLTVGYLGLQICWRGSSPALAADIRRVVRSLRIAADPWHRGPWPD